MAKNSRNEVAPQAWEERIRIREGTASFPVRAVKFSLWVAVIFGIVAALANPVAALIWPDKAQVTVPVDISKSQLSAGSNRTTLFTVEYSTEFAPPIELTGGQYNVPLSKLVLVDKVILLLGSSILALIVSYSAWLQLGIIRSLPAPFTFANTTTLLRLGWLGLGVKAVNGLMGFYMVARVFDKINAGRLPPPIASGFAISSHGLTPAFDLSWSFILGAFVLALIFRIGVQHRENEQLLHAERELTV